MPPNSADASFLWDMLRYARTVGRLVSGKTLEDYERDEILRLAVERAVEIVGEASRDISENFKKTHAEIPWRSIEAQRHVLAHDYGEIVNEKIWRVATHYIPALILQIEPLVPPPPIP